MDTHNTTREFNPDAIIDSRYHNGKNYHIIRDDELVGGTKQRALLPYLTKLKQEHSHITELLYAGPDTGYAQIALAYVGGYCGFKVRLFLQSSNGIKNNLTIRASKYGANYILIQDSLRAVTTAAEQHIKQNPTSMLIPFGCDTPEYEEELVSALRLALQNVTEPKRLWLTVGSGALMKAISTVWKNTQILAVVVGRNIYLEDYEEQLRSRVIIYDAKKYNQKQYPGYGAYKFSKPLQKHLMPSYSSLATYDAKVWIFASKDLQEGDYIWNVGRD